MADELRACFEKYVAFVRTEAERARSRSAALGSTDNDEMVLKAVDLIESGDDFGQLARVTAQEFKGSSDITGKEIRWQSHVGRYFRLSGMYQSIFSGHDIEKERAIDRYREAFKSKTNTVTYLAPLEFIDLSVPSIDLGDFKIWEPGRAELDRMLNNTAKRLFYRWAYVDLTILSQCWFIVAEETVPAEKLGRGIILHFNHRVDLSYSRYPAVIESALAKLALFDWTQYGFFRDHETSGSAPREYKPFDGPLHPNVPFVLSVSDSLVEWPSNVPSLSVLATEPVFDQSGEEVGERPATALHVDGDESERLSLFLKTVSSQLAEVRRIERWPFINTALGFLVKGFTTPNGIEQLLWHITTVEALIGENGSGLVNTLLRRISTILGKTEGERKMWKKQFDKMYKFRFALRPD